MARITLLMLVLATIGLSTASIKDVCLNAHNKLRELHEDTSPLVWDDSLAHDAQFWANKLAQDKVLQHDGNSKDGENLYDGVSVAVKSCADAALQWYNEYQYYDYNNPSVNSAVGHFTQLVWADSVKLGVGIASYESGGYHYTYIVARYSPAGNYPSQVGSRVKPRKVGATVPTLYELDPSACKDAAGEDTCNNYHDWGFCEKSNPYYIYMDSNCAKKCKIC